MDTARHVAEVCAASLGAACTPPGLPSSGCSEPTQPFRACGAELVSAPGRSTSTPGEQEHGGCGVALAPQGTGSSRDALGGAWACAVAERGLGMLRVSSEPEEDGQRSPSASPFQSPVSGTQRLSLPLPPPSSPRHPSASLGWVSSIPKQLFLHQQHCS